MDDILQEAYDVLLDDLLYHQGKEDYGHGVDPVVADMAYLMGYATAEDEDRYPTPADPDEQLPV